MADELDFTRRHFVMKSFASWLKTAANMDDIANEILVTSKIIKFSENYTYGNFMKTAISLSF